jgi:hypothetical protein
VRLFERQWLVNVILYGNFARLRDAVLDELGAPICGRTLQVACVYGDFSVRLAERIGPGGSLDVIAITASLGRSGSAVASASRPLSPA